MPGSMLRDSSVVCHFGGFFFPPKKIRICAAWTPVFVLGCAFQLNYRMMEWFGFEGTLKTIQFQAIMLQFCCRKQFVLRDVLKNGLEVSILMKELNGRESPELTKPGGVSGCFWK